jgi:hypothetical protein
MTEYIPHRRVSGRRKGVASQSRRDALAEFAASPSGSQFWSEKAGVLTPIEAVLSAIHGVEQGPPRA